MAKVSKKGLITPKYGGKAKIAITLTSGRKLTLTVKVTDPLAPKKLTIKQGKKATLKVGGKLKLAVRYKPVNARTKLTWKTSNRKVATVTSKGVVKAKKAGTAKITVTAANGKKATIKIIVKKKK